LLPAHEEVAQAIAQLQRLELREICGNEFRGCSSLFERSVVGIGTTIVEAVRFEIPVPEQACLAAIKDKEPAQIDFALGASEVVRQTS
jgi:hypothetical protein